MCFSYNNFKEYYNLRELYNSISLVVWLIGILFLVSKVHKGTLKNILIFVMIALIFILYNKKTQARFLKFAFDKYNKIEIEKEVLKDSISSNEQLSIALIGIFVTLIIVAPSLPNLGVWYFAAFIVAFLAFNLIYYTEIFNSRLLEIYKELDKKSKPASSSKTPQ